LNPATPPASHPGATTSLPPSHSGTPGHAAAPPHGVTSINPSTTVSGHAGHGGAVVSHTAADDGSKVVVQHQGPGGAHVTAYKEHVNTQTGAHTKMFADGHRVISTRDTVAYGAPHQMSYVRHSNGLREAGLPNGRPVFHERFVGRRDEFGRENRFIERTVYTAVAAGVAVALGVPLVQTYAVVPYNGIEIYPYAPMVVEPGIIVGMRRPFLAPVIVGPACLFCPPPVIAFAEPVMAYNDPVEMMADMQIATAFNDGMSVLDESTLPPPPPDYTPPPYYAPVSTDEVSQLQQQVASLEQQVQAEAQNNQGLRDQLGMQQSQTADLTAQVAAMQQPPVKKPIAIDNTVRTQVRQQVKDELSLHEKNQSSTLPAIVSSPAAANHIFQVAANIDATSVDTGLECRLSTGDLLKFDAVPDATDASAQMRVIAANSGSCGSGTAVQISATDLQDMLNAFSQRFESNLGKVKGQLASQ